MDLTLQVWQEISILNVFHNITYEYFFYVKLYIVDISSKMNF